MVSKSFCWGGAVAECMSGCVGVLFPKIAYQIELPLYASELMRRGAFFTKRREPVIFIGTVVPAAPTPPRVRVEERPPADHTDYVRPLERERIETAARVITEQLQMRVTAFLERLAAANGIDPANADVPFVADPIITQYTKDALDQFYTALTQDSLATANARMVDAVTYVEELPNIMERFCMLKFLEHNEVAPPAAPSQIYLRLRRLMAVPLDHLGRPLDPLLTQWNLVKRELNLHQLCLTQWLADGDPPVGAVGDFAYSVKTIQMECSARLRMHWIRFWQAGIEAWRDDHFVLFAADAVAPAVAMVNPAVGHDVRQLDPAGGLAAGAIAHAAGGVPPVVRRAVADTLD